MSRNKAAQVIAKSLFKELSAQGYEMRHVIALANALLDEALAAREQRAR
ncbi:MAG: hypothetical protein AAGC55_05185 [Myxococcota bacterium]